MIMKTRFFVIAVFLLGAMGMVSCERPPEFSFVPKIAFEKVTYEEIPATQDLLNVTIYFEDGDGDLGVTSEEAKHPPFHENTYFQATPPHHPVYNLEGISTEFLLKLGDIDTLPPYNCVNYMEFDRKLPDNSTVIDIVYRQPNPMGKNFRLKFFIKKGETFEEYNFMEETCISSDGTFTRLNTADYDRPLQGNLTYTFRASNLKTYFGSYPIKLQVQIMDRKGNLSNIAESPEFTLDEVLIR